MQFLLSLRKSYFLLLYLPGQIAVTLLADLLLGAATARHHSTAAQTVGAEGASAALTAQLGRKETLGGKTPS